MRPRWRRPPRLRSFTTIRRAIRAERRRCRTDPTARRGRATSWESRSLTTSFSGTVAGSVSATRGSAVRTLYFDCFSGAAGDMILGALIDAGLPVGELKHALGSLGVEGWDISAERVVKCGITATKFRVHEHAPTVAGRPVAGPPAIVTTTCLGSRSALISQRFRTAGGAGQGAVRSVWPEPKPNSQHADREGSPARGGRPRLDRRHRRHASSPSNGLAPTESSCRRSTSEAVPSRRRTASIPCQRRRRFGCWATRRSMAARSRRNC